MSNASQLSSVPFPSPVRACRRRSTVALALATVCALGVAAKAAHAAELRAPLPDILESAAPDDWIPVTIVMDRQMTRDEARSIAVAYPDKSERRRHLVTRLRQEALRGQVALRTELVRLEPDGLVRDLRSLWISSVIGAEVRPALLRRIAERDDVAWINHNPKVDVFLERPRLATSSLGDAPFADAGPETSSVLPSGGTTTEDTVAEIECGVVNMRAPDVWNDFGVTGEGAVIAVIDTGVCWTHPDIANQIWVNPGEDLDGDGVVMDPDDANGVDDDGNGFVDDFIGWDFDQGDNDPNDDNSHGSHCAGTVSGDGASGTQAGMAPGADIMVLRVGTSFSDELDVWNAMQYAAENGADSISMSLGWPHNQNPDRTTWRNNCENTIDLGTAMVIAAGNEDFGNEPDNVRTPGDVPRIISVGAVDCSDDIASFSSRGPVTWQDVAPWNDHPYPPGLIKPDVSGPGVSTKSHNLCNGYSFKSGTSMATPHVAGAVALMVSANPTLEHDDIKTVLEDTAIDLGSPGKDNEYGTGRVDAYEAVQFVASALRYDSHTVDDSDPDRANGDGNVDYDEVVTIAVTLRNAGEEAVSGVFARLFSDDPSVEVLDDVAYFPALGPDVTGTSAAPHFTIRFGQGCGQVASLRLEMFHDGGDPSFGRFSIRIGDRQVATFLDDDMETDSGWTTSGTEVTNAFVREDPNEVEDGGVVFQPEDDATDPGVAAFVTGNPRTQGNFNPGDGDVDARAELTSPVFDATAGDELTVDLSRWVYIGTPGFGDTSHYALQVSNDGGSNWLEVERLGPTEGGWVTRSLPLAIAATDSMRLRVVAAQELFGQLGDPMVEVLVDDIRVHGARYVCDAYTAPAAQAPNAVGNTLTVDRVSGGTDGVRLDWADPAVDAGHDAATFFHVYRSGQPDGGFAESATPTAPFHVELDGDPTGYFMVSASNGGGGSGEEPAP